MYFQKDGGFQRSREWADTFEYDTDMKNELYFICRNKNCNFQIPMAKMSYNYS